MATSEKYQLRDNTKLTDVTNNGEQTDLESESEINIAKRNNQPLGQNYITEQEHYLKDQMKFGDYQEMNKDISKQNKNDYLFAKNKDSLLEDINIKKDSTKDNSKDGSKEISKDNSQTIKTMNSDQRDENKNMQRLKRSLVHILKVPLQQKNE